MIMKKTLLLTLLTLAAMASEARIQGEAYDLKVCGQQVETSNMADVLGDGTVSFDGGNTLTLNGASITIDEASGFGIYNQIADLEVVVKGYNTIESKQWTALFSSQNIHFKGSGTLRLKGYSWGLSCGSSATTVTISNGIHLVCEGGERATAANPTYGGGFAGDSNRFGRCTTTLEVSGSDTWLEVKGTGVASSLYDLKALTLTDGLSVKAPAGAVFNETKHAVCQADGSVVTGKWVVISGKDSSEDYWLTIGETWITSDNCTDVKCPELKSGKVSYDPTTRTLILSNVVINAINTSGVFMWPDYKDDGFTLRLEGTNTITLNKEDTKVIYNAVLLRNECTISGPGKLITNSSICMNGGDLTIKNDCKISAGWLYNNPTYGYSNLIIGGDKTEISLSAPLMALYGFSSLTRDIDLKYIVPGDGSKYSGTDGGLIDSEGNRAKTVYIAREAKSGDYDLWVCGVHVNSSNQDNIPVSSGKASYDPYAKKLTLDGVYFTSSWSNDYGVGNGDVDYGAPGDLLTVEVNGTCTFDCASSGLHLNGGITTITGSGKLIVKSSHEAALRMADGSTLNLKDADVSLTASSDPAIQGQSWMKAEVVNVSHSSLEAYSPTYTTDQISDLNLIRSRFADVDSRSGDLFGFDATQGGSITYDEAAYQGRVIIEPYEVYFYDIYLDGTEITSKNMDDPMGDGAFSYDPESNTLIWKKDAGYTIQNHNEGLTLQVAEDVASTCLSSSIEVYNNMTISGPGKLTCKGNIWANTAQLTIADANVACGQLCGNDGAADVLVVKNATVKATRVSAFGGGITLEGCAITSPKGASIDGGRIVGQDGLVVITGVTIEPLTPKKKGDVNNDNNVDVADIASIIDYMAGATIPDASASGRADVNGDGNVDVADISTVIDIMAGKIVEEDPVMGSAPAGVEAVDLGLPSGTRWASMNIGAQKPEDAGLYFAWGETTGYTDNPLDGRLFNWNYYKWMTSGEGSWEWVSKYQVADGETDGCWYDADGNFVGDGLSTLDLSDDAARANWGGQWVMPTYEDIRDLVKYVPSEWTTLNGVSGRKFTSEVTGNSIFLPVTGYRSGVALSQTSSGYYWSATVHESDTNYANVLGFSVGGAGMYNSIRNNGECVRAVIRK